MFLKKEYEDLYKCIRKGHVHNWQTTHAKYIERWENRYQNFVNGNIAEDSRASEEYKNWYWSHTLVHVVNPNTQVNAGFRNIAPSQEILAEGMGLMHRELRNRMPNDDLSLMPGRYMHEAQVPHRMSVDQLYFRQDHHAFSGHAPSPVQSHRQPRNRGSGQTSGDVGSSSSHPPRPQFVAEQEYSTRFFGNSSSQPPPPQSYPNPDILTLGFASLQSQQSAFQSPYQQSYFANDYTPQMPEMQPRNMQMAPALNEFTPVQMDLSGSWLNTPIATSHQHSPQLSHNSRFHTPTPAPEREGGRPQRQKKAPQCLTELQRRCRQNDD